MARLQQQTCQRGFGFQVRWPQQADHHQTVQVGGVQQGPEQIQGERVGPLQVVEHQHQRPAEPRQGAQQGHQQAEQPLRHLIGLQCRWIGQGLAEALQFRQQGQQGGGIAAQGSAQGRRQLLPEAGAGRSGQLQQQPAQGLSWRLQHFGTEELLALAEREVALGPLHRLAQLLHQGGLAHTGFAADPHHLGA